MELVLVLPHLSGTTKHAAEALSEQPDDISPQVCLGVVLTLAETQRHVTCFRKAGIQHVSAGVSLSPLRHTCGENAVGCEFAVQRVIERRDRKMREVLGRGNERR